MATNTVVNPIQTITTEYADRAGRLNTLTLSIYFVDTPVRFLMQTECCHEPGSPLLAW